MNSSRFAAGFSLVRYYKLRNFGNLAVKFEGLSIEQSGCRGFGFEIRNCHAFSLAPSGFHVLEIAFSLDFSQKFVRRTLYLSTKKEIFAFSLVFEEFSLSFQGNSVNFQGNPGNFHRNSLFFQGNYLNFQENAVHSSEEMQANATKLLETAIFSIALGCLLASLLKIASFRRISQHKSRGLWKLAEASEVFELRDQNYVFSFENDLYELRKLRQAVKQTGNYSHNLLMEATQSESPRVYAGFSEEDKRLEQGNQGNQEALLEERKLVENTAGNEKKNTAKSKKDKKKGKRESVGAKNRKNQKKIKENVGKSEENLRENLEVGEKKEKIEVQENLQLQGF